MYIQNVSDGPQYYNWTWPHCQYEKKTKIPIQGEATLSVRTSGKRCHRISAIGCTSPLKLRMVLSGDQYMKQTSKDTKPVNIDDLLKGVDVEGPYRNLARIEGAGGADPLAPLYGAVAAMLYGEVDRLEKGGYQGHQSKFLMQMAQAYATKSGYGIPGQEKGYGRQKPAGYGR